MRRCVVVVALKGEEWSDEALREYGCAMLELLRLCKEVDWADSEGARLVVLPHLCEAAKAAAEGLRARLKHLEIHVLEEEWPEA